MEKGGRKEKHKRDEEKITKGKHKHDEERIIRKKRGPLQDLNGPPLCKIRRKNSSNLSSSAASSSTEAPKGCLRLLISSNSRSSSSSSSSSACSSKTLIEKRPKAAFSKLGFNEGKNSTAYASKLVRRSKENEAPKKPLLQKSRKLQPQGVSTTKSIGKNGQRSKISSGQINPATKLKKGNEEFQVQMKNPQENCTSKLLFDLRRLPNLNSAAESFTPLGKDSTLSNLDCENFVGHKNVVDDSVNEAADNNTGTGTDAKTPPIEVSLSPEIQRQSHSKKLVLNSAATPVCYGAGHLVSGVTDNRKCRRRGSLRGGCERINLFDDERSEGGAVGDLRDSLVPLPAEASVRWLLSPCREGAEDCGGDSTERLSECRRICDNDFDTSDFLSSSSLLCGNTPDLFSADSGHSDSDTTGSIACTTRNKNGINSIRKVTKFEGLLGSLNDVDESLLASLPSGACRSNDIELREAKNFSPNLIGGDSALSVGSLSSGNIIQTPNSNSSLDPCVEGLRSELNCSNIISLELDSIAETLSRVDLSPGSEILKWDTSSSGVHFTKMAPVACLDDLTRVQRNADSVSSWASGSVLDTMALSQMKISWQDGLVSGNEQTDEFDCCCLLDQEISADKSRRDSKLGAKLINNEENDSGRDMDISPILSEYEPCISARGKEKLSSHTPDVCAESICTDGGSLVASGNCDWAYSLDNHFFAVK